MVEYHEFVLDEIPEGSRLERYLKEVPKVMGNKEKAISFLNAVFLECYDFVWQNTKILYLPRIVVKFAFSHDQFKKAEERESKDSISKEAVKKPEMTRAFSVYNKFLSKIYVDLKAHTDLLKFNNLTFIVSLVDAYMNEILHIGFPQKYEQEIYELQCRLIEPFLGIRLPKEKKKLRASDYYYKIE